MSVTREQIAAYADGELTGAELAEVEAALAADPALAEQVERHRELKKRLGAHFAPFAEQPVPERLTTLLQTGAESAGVVSFAAERRRRGLAPMVRRWAPIAGPALAASLVLALWQPWRGGDVPDGYAQGELATALDTQLVASQGLAVEPRILLTFRDRAGQYCRVYREARTGGIACHDETGWKIERELGAGLAQTTDYRQAGSDTRILAAAQEMSVGEALDAVAEAEARDRGWQ